MRKELIESALVFLAIVGPVGAWVVFWVGKIVNLRGEIKELQMNRNFDRQLIDRQDKRIDELQCELDKVIEWYNRGRNN